MAAHLIHDPLLRQLAVEWYDVPARSENLEDLQMPPGDVFSVFLPSIEESPPGASQTLRTPSIGARNGCSTQQLDRRKAETDNVQTRLVLLTEIFMSSCLVRTVKTHEE